MRRILMSVVLLTLVLTTATWAAPIEKPAINQQSYGPSVALQSHSRIDLLFESFEGAFPPAGWTIMTTGNTYTWLQAGAGNTGDFSAAVPYGNVGQWQDEWLVTPAIDATGIAAMFLEFAENEDYWADWGLEHNVMVSTTVPDDPAAFTDLLSMTPANHTIDGWSLVSVNLTPYVGLDNIYVAFRYQGDYADNWYVDDVHIFEPPEHDVALKSLTPADAIEYPGQVITPQIVVENKGQNSETFAVNLMITHDGLPVVDETITVVDLAVGGTAAVDFSPFTTVLGAYVLTGATLLAGDLVPENDTGAGVVACWGGQRTPFGILYTEWGCDPCVAPNQALDSYYPTLGNDAALMRVHVWWPSGTDPMYHANPDECDYLLGMTPTVVNAVPNPYMDNILDVYSLDFADWPEGVELAYETSEDLPSPLSVQLGYNLVTGNVEVFVDVINSLSPDRDYRLFVGVTEDNLENLGPNGEQFHNQCFRQLFPGVDGMSIDPALGLAYYEVPISFNPRWVFENLRAVAWIQDYPGGPVLNCGTVFLTEGVVSNGDYGIGDDTEETDTPVLLTQVKGAYPNPFNPQTTIEFSVARPQHVTLAIYNMNGQHVTTLVNATVEAGDHPVQWNGTDVHGRGVSSGSYIVHLQSEDRVSASKIMLVR